MLQLTNVEVRYAGGILGLQGLSLNVPEGYIVALLGANGAGKSTTLKAVSGLLTSDGGHVADGSVAFDGEPLEGLDPADVVRLGIFHVMEGRRVFSTSVSKTTFARAHIRVGARHSHMTWSGCTATSHGYGSVVEPRRLICRAASSRCWPSAAHSWRDLVCCCSTSHHWAWPRSRCARSSD